MARIRHFWSVPRSVRQKAMTLGRPSYWIKQIRSARETMKRSQPSESEPTN